MNKKKAQISYFILIVAILIISLMVYLYINQEVSTFSIEKLSKLPYNPIPVKEFINLCLSRTLENGINVISLQGGYYNVPKPKRKNNNLEIPYYFYHNNIDYPNLDVINKELTDYTHDNFLDCLNDFQVFKQEGYNIESDRLEVNISFDNIVFANINYPLNIELGESNTNLEEFTYNMDLNFIKIYGVILKLIDEFIKNPNYVPIGAITELASIHKFNFDIVQETDNDVIYNFIFNSSFKEDYIFSFAAYYDWSHLQNDVIDEKLGE